MHLFTHRKMFYHWLIFQLLSHETSLREVWNAAERNIISLAAQTGCMTMCTTLVTDAKLHSNSQIQTPCQISL